MAIKPIEPGTVAGSYTVLAHLGSNTHGQAMWSIQCNQCQNIEMIAGYKLRQGKTKRCGKCKTAAKKTEKRNAPHSNQPV